MISNPYGLKQIPTHLRPHSYGLKPNMTPLIGSRVIGTNTHIPSINQYQTFNPYQNNISTSATQLKHIQNIQGQSRIQYIPYERKYIDYQTKQYTDKVPVQRIVIDYKQVKKVDYVPKQRTVTDYYAVEYQTSYVPQTIPQKVIQYVPVQKVTQRVEYFPVQKQIIHYPQQSIRRSRSQVFNSGIIRNTHNIQNVSPRAFNTFERPTTVINTQGNINNGNMKLNTSSSGHFTTILTGAPQYTRPTSNYNTQIGFTNEIKSGSNNEYQLMSQKQPYGIKINRNFSDTNESTKLLQKNELTKSNYYFDENNLNSK